MGVLLLVGDSVWHGNGCAVNDFDVTSFPEGILWDVALAAIGDVFGDVCEGFFGEFASGLAEGDCLRRGLDLGARGDAPSLESAYDFAAGDIWRKHLSEKGPEDNWEAILATPAMGAFGGGGEEIVGNGVATSGFQIA